MIKYLFLQTILTAIFFIVWIESTTLSGGDVGMMPMLMGMFLLIHLGIGLTFSIIFRRHHKSVNSRLVGMLIYLAVYQFGPLAIGDKPMFWEIFENGYSGETSRAFALTSLVAGVLMLIVIELRERKRTV